MNTGEGRKRVVIDGVAPEIDCGAFPIKRVIGDRVSVEANIFTDGHDAISAELLYRHDSAPGWSSVTMEPRGNDRWQAHFLVEKLGGYHYTITAWIDRFQTWRRDFAKRLAASQQTAFDLTEGAGLIAEALEAAPPEIGLRLKGWLKLLRSEASSFADKTNLALDEDLARVVTQYLERRFAVTYPRELAVTVDKTKARYSTWYEMFPRSSSLEAGKHGTFQTCVARLSDIAAMGFDVLYLPPIHPIGKTHRKGRNNALNTTPEDPGTPWAIGASAGGHKSVHPELGTLEDFRHLVAQAERAGLEIALDLAFQCSPDHPYLAEHPEWFRWRADGTVQFAENPPKRYEDICPFDFESEHWFDLWQELKSIVIFWISQGVRIFRVDNPHTKPFRFWEWLIGEIKRDYPEIIFLSEAFTRPSLMFHLAKLGFTQSYTYFAWRNTKWELTQYFTELAYKELREYFRPSLWPNTPDILTEYLQFGGRPAFIIRLVLAATLGASYGIYGPAFELMENRSREPGSEEYLNSEKYEVRHWDYDRPGTLRDFIARVNRIRQDNPALQSDANLRFHPVDNDQIICFSKHTDDLANVIVVVVNLDAHHTQSAWMELPLEALGLDGSQTYQMHDLLSDARYLWQGRRGYVQLDPRVVPASIFLLRRYRRSEQSFDYYL
jgi:starch synthase (maltosyl-transferring)